MAKGWKSHKEEQEVKIYTTDEEMVYALDAIIESCEAIIRRTRGVSEEEFLLNDDMMKASAMDMLVIGNFAGRFPTEIREKSKNINDAYGFRCRIAHDYGTFQFETGYLWEAVSSDVYDILDTSRRLRLEILSGKMGSHNTKNRRRFLSL